MKEVRPRWRVLLSGIDKDCFVAHGVEFPLLRRGNIWRGPVQLVELEGRRVHLRLSSSYLDGQQPSLRLHGRFYNTWDVFANEFLAVAIVSEFAFALGFLNLAGQSVYCLALVVSSDEGRCQ